LKKQKKDVSQLTEEDIVKKRMQKEKESKKQGE
jgi:hypothetical protein